MLPASGKTWASRTARFPVPRRGRFRPPMARARNGQLPPARPPRKAHLHRLKTSPERLVGVQEVSIGVFAARKAPELPFLGRCRRQGLGRNGCLEGRDRNQPRSLTHGEERFAGKLRLAGERFGRFEQPPRRDLLRLGAEARLRKAQCRFVRRCECRQVIGAARCSGDPEFGPPRVRSPEGADLRARSWAACLQPRRE